MPKGDKFIALTAYLEKCGKDEIKMSFSDIEKILGFQLSNAVYLYPAQWSNSESQSFAFETDGAHFVDLCGFYKQVHKSSKHGK